MELVETSLDEMKDRAKKSDGLNQLYIRRHLHQLRFSYTYSSANEEIPEISISRSCKQGSSSVYQVARKRKGEASHPGRLLEQGMYRVSRPFRR